MGYLIEKNITKERGHRLPLFFVYISYKYSFLTLLFDIYAIFNKKSIVVCFFCCTFALSFGKVVSNRIKIVRNNGI
jgi:hypothetical protein